VKNYCIVGSGRQGTAAAYDIVTHGDPKSLTIIDSSVESLDRCQNKIKGLTGFTLRTVKLDISDEALLLNELRNIDIFLSSVPYSFNLYLTDIAIKSRTSMVDLGGHTNNVISQLERSDEAREAGICIVPDCGMGPGMNISMALLAMEGFDRVDEVRVWDGGLPLDPQPPWNYNLFFNIAGLTNEYDGNAYFIRGGRVTEVPCFRDVEELEFGSRIGTLEAAVTSGGLSTMPWTYEGKIQLLENKTLRYRGHWEQMRAYRELGLFEEEKIKFNGALISPRDFYHHLLEPRLSEGEPADVCIMRTEAIGIINGEKRTKRAECMETYNEKTGFLAMEMWTGFHASMVMQHIADLKLSPGAHPIEKALSGVDFYNYSEKRGYGVTTEVH
jgi:lysine 6-dehydrogenase